MAPAAYAVLGGCILILTWLEYGPRLCGRGDCVYGITNKRAVILSVSNASAYSAMAVLIACLC